MPLEIVRNDITKMRVDAIVNAANPSLLGGGGVDGAIHRAAGPGLLAECRALGGCETGQARITKGYDLPCKYVIHTVGPIWRGGNHGEEELLTSCYRNSLSLAAACGCETVAFPLISAGAYSYPRDQAMAVAVDAITHYLYDHDLTVYLVVFGRGEFLTGKKLFRDVQAYIDDVYADSHLVQNAESARALLWRKSQEAALLLEQSLTEEPEEELEASIEPPPLAAPSMAQPDWDRLLRQTDEGFSAALLRLIDEKGLTDVQCYKRANVDRKLFSKIRSNPAYRPSKPTAFAFAVALRLNLSETKSLLDKAGYSLSHSSKFDIVLEYFIKNRRYDVFEINQVLFEFDLPLLGSAVIG